MAWHSLCVLGWDGIFGMVWLLFVKNGIPLASTMVLDSALEHG
jgi:hypothetical protein